MENPGEMNTLSNILDKIRQKGFDHELRMSDHNHMQSADYHKIYNPEELKIIKTYRFEGESDPSDAAILFIIEDMDGNKGYVLNAYGMYSTHDEAGFNSFMQKIPLEHHDEQLIFH
jgi:hypothetical protein